MLRSGTAQQALSALRTCFQAFAAFEWHPETASVPDTVQGPGGPGQESRAAGPRPSGANTGPIEDGIQWTTTHVRVCSGHGFATPRSGVFFTTTFKKVFIYVFGCAGS